MLQKRENQSSLRRWRKAGLGRVGMSGRKPLYQLLELELFEIFKAKRAKGNAMTNQDLLREPKERAVSLG